MDIVYSRVIDENSRTDTAWSSSEIELFFLGSSVFFKEASVQGVIFKFVYFCYLSSAATQVINEGPIQYLKNSRTSSASQLRVTSRNSPLKNTSVHFSDLRLGSNPLSSYQLLNDYLPTPKDELLGILPSYTCAGNILCASLQTQRSNMLTTKPHKGLRPRIKTHKPCRSLQYYQIYGFRMKTQISFKGYQSNNSQDFPVSKDRAVNR